MEIERKFLIDNFPENLPLKEESILYQGYISVMPTVRIRKKIFSKGSSYKMTIKSNGEMIRHEIEFDIPEKKYNELSEEEQRHVSSEFRKTAHDGEFVFSDDKNARSLTPQEAKEELIKKRNALLAKLGFSAPVDVTEESKDMDSPRRGR